MKEVRKLQNRANRNLQVIKEETVHFDSVKLQLDHDLQQQKRSSKKAVPHSVDVLIRKQEILCQELNRMDRKLAYMSNNLHSGSGYARYQPNCEL